MNVRQVDKHFRYSNPSFQIPSASNYKRRNKQKQKIYFIPLLFLLHDDDVSTSRKNSLDDDTRVEFQLALILMNDSFIRVGENLDLPLHHSCFSLHFRDISA